MFQSLPYVNFYCLFTTCRLCELRANVLGAKLPQYFTFQFIVGCMSRCVRHKHPERAHDWLFDMGASPTHPNLGLCYNRVPFWTPWPFYQIAVRKKSMLNQVQSTVYLSVSITSYECTQTFYPYCKKLGVGLNEPPLYSLSSSALRATNFWKLNWIVEELYKFIQNFLFRRLKKNVDCPIEAGVFLKAKTDKYSTFPCHVSFMLFLACWSW